MDKEMPSSLLQQPKRLIYTTCWAALLAVLLGVTLYVIWRRVWPPHQGDEGLKEGFQNVRGGLPFLNPDTQIETPNELIFLPEDTLRALESSQNEARDEFHYRLGKQPELTPVDTCPGNYAQSKLVERPGELVINSRAVGGIPDFEAKYNEALKPAGVWRMDSPATDYARILNAIPFGAQQEKEEVCRRIKHPSDIDRSDVDDGTEEGCGWLFVPDGDVAGGTLLRESVCLLGGPKGPTLPDSVLKPFMDVGAQWIWKKADAVRREDIKRARRVRDCTTAVGTSGMAFCRPTEDDVKGHGIPYNPITGFPRFNTPVMTGGSAPVEETWSAEGRCRGGVISYNMDTCPKVNGNIVSTCPPAGPINSACVTAVLDAKGFKPEGALRTYRDVSDADKRPDISLLLLVLREEGGVHMSEADILGVGSTKTVREFTQAIDKIVRFTEVQGISKILRDTAYYMKEGRITAEKAPFGELYFDFCNYYTETASRVALQPVALACLQQEFRKVGCQSKGSKFPQNMFDKDYVGKSLNQIRADFREYRQGMVGAQTVAAQRDAVKKCLGIDMVSKEGEKGEACNERGIEYMIFSYDVGRNRTLRYRFKSTEGFVKDARQSEFNVGRGLKLAEEMAARMSKEETNTIPGTGSLQMGYLARTVFRTRNDLSITENRWIVRPSTYTIRLNDGPVEMTEMLTRTTTPGTKQYLIVVPKIAPSERNTLEVEYVGDPGMTWGNPAIEYVDRNLEQFQLSQAFFDPVIRYDFNNGTMLDINRLTRIRTDSVVLSNRVATATSSAVAPGGALSGCSVSPINQQGLTWRVRPTIEGNSVELEGMRVRNGSIHMIMMSVFVPSDSNGAVVYTLTGGPRFTETLTIGRSSIEYTHSAGEPGYNRIVFDASDLLLDRWIHVAIGYDHADRKEDARIDEQMMSVWVNGKQRMSSGGLAKIVLKGKAQPWETSMTIQLMSSKFTGHIGWFHVYDQKTSDLETLIRGDTNTSTSASTLEGFQNSGSWKPLTNSVLSADVCGTGIEDAPIPVGRQVDRRGYTFPEIDGRAPAAAVVQQFDKIYDVFDTTMYRDDGSEYTQSSLLQDIPYSPAPASVGYNGSLLDCHGQCEKSKECVAFSYTGTNCKLFRNVKTLSSSDGTISVRQVARELPVEQDKNLLEIINLQQSARNAIKQYYGITTPKGATSSAENVTTIDDEPSFINYLSKAASNAVSIYETMFPPRTNYASLVRLGIAPPPTATPPVSVETAISDYKSTFKTFSELTKLQNNSQLADHTNNMRLIITRYSVEDFKFPSPSAGPSTS